MCSLTIQAFLRGTMWSMSMSPAAVNLTPSYGDTQVPDSATQAPLVLTSVPSRLRTNSLDGVSLKQLHSQSWPCWCGNIPCVASSLDGVPGRKLGATIAITAQRRSNFEAGEEGPGRGRAWDTRLVTTLLVTRQDQKFSGD
jgi:hypothetical protein